jgi:hypothetical protein
MTAPFVDVFVFAARVRAATALQHSVPKNIGFG